MTKSSAPAHDDEGPATVPKVRLYVERAEEKDTWLVNVGHVVERGRWKTKPHAHPGYGQVIFVRQGCGVMNLDGHDIPFAGPCALLVPTEYVHGFDYEVDVDRWVVTIEVTYLMQINAKLPQFLQLWGRPRVVPFSKDQSDAGKFYGQIRRLEREIKSKSAGHVVGTEALLTYLLLTLVRCIQPEQADDERAPGHATRLIDRFRELIDLHYRENLRLQDYTSMLAVSPRQLRIACAAAAGLSPTKMIHARIITEAKRNLIFSHMTVEQIAYWLGFQDTSHFTRFFRTEVGQPPSQFRVTARSQPHWTN